MTKSQDLAGRHAVITGASFGLGRAIAERLDAAGAQITAIDLPSALHALPGSWRSAGVDLSTAAAQDELCKLADAVSPVDILVANAGVVPPWRGVDVLDADEWQRVMAINVWGVAATLGAFTASLEASGRGSAILMASINGYRAHPKQVLYSASKHAVIGIMRAAALDLGKRSIRVNALAPGPIATDALVSRIDARHGAGGPAREKALAALAEESALGRIATAEEVANAAHFLASDASSGMTGVVVPVEAGLA